MKINSISFLVLTMVFTAIVTRDSTNVTHIMKRALEREYPRAESPMWQKTDDYQMATFSFIGHLAIAYFSHDGELLGSARNIFINELRFVVMKFIERSIAKVLSPAC